MTETRKRKLKKELLRHEMMAEIIRERLEGESPAGPPSESGCGDAERRNDQRPTDIPRGSAVVEAKGRVEQWLHVENWEREAAWFEEESSLFSTECRCPTINAYKRVAAAFRQCASELEAALSAQPRPQREGKSAV
jgi:hypothetical protein